jgi:dynamin 1-like protein
MPMLRASILTPTSDDRQAMSDDDADRSVSGPEDEEDVGFVVPNGRPSSSRQNMHENKSRSTSSSIHDRSKGGPDFGGNPSSSTHHASASSSSSHARKVTPNASSHLSAGGIPAFASPYGASPSSSTAKESFLNYFFGGSEMSNPGDSRSGQRSTLPDISRERVERGDNPLSGRRGLEGNAAAFDMKSLDKHLEAVSRPFLLALLSRVD